MMYEEMRLCLSDLLDQDLTSYEYFYSLPDDLQKEIKKLDPRSFQQMQEFAEKLRGQNSVI